jgi:hypothetical protein
LKTSLKYLVKPKVGQPSGDNKPSNYGDNPGELPPGTIDANGDKIPDGNPTVEKGYTDTPGTLSETDIDKTNDNTGTGTGGEPNRFVITSDAAVLNGPQDAADAVGPGNDNNKDFTNKSAVVPADKAAPGSTYDPGVVTFSNTVKNTSSLSNNISLLPTPPANATDLPNNTVVTITYPTTGESKSYVWDAANSKFKFDGDGDFTSTGDQSDIDATNEYITIANVPGSTTVNYTVKVDLPDGTKLSTDNDMLKGFPVPITAFVDDATPGLGTEAAKNTTIDRVYTGFLKMLKESQILQGDGPDVQGTDGTFSTTAKTPAPGNIIVYRITYTNISEPQPADGSNNVILKAKNVVITEDGTAGTNNWAKDNDGDSKIDTIHVTGSASDSKGGVIEYSTGANVGAEGAGVTKYVDTVTGEILPGDAEKGTFTFQRQVYKPEPPSNNSN